ncbi:hypothetical protein OM308_24490 [Escherichia albertii]|uniref:hypothetical protein n=1 Tax=Escherichia albertii TaxID=208962 RepID=UPI0019E98E23|nr:hypothetical protein [Escherichia albertii]MCZ9075601.1 hypothetical protein [Escherichia albertii]MCZ9097534.1 hypothetical protein [Escherichia albertii]MCZ9102064.1 hypothetical protein [Escherichia albertii]MCZ9125425.1 hypothetical protein [Escherichia albertii]WDC09109.1 hypothetical protein PS036_24925 [Escherichia albertii]
MSDKVTVKQTINKVTSIYKIEQITVGKPGSEQFRHAFELADQLGLKHPDCIEHVFPTYADAECTQVLTEEDFFSTEERENVGRCIGVICSSVSSELFPDVPESCGIGYQFLYEGDELKCYEHGLLIESVE